MNLNEVWTRMPVGKCRNDGYWQVVKKLKVVNEIETWISKQGWLEGIYEDSRMKWNLF